MFHPFDTDIELIEPRQFNNPFCYAPHPAVAEAARQVMAYVAGKEEWRAELSEGKMFGVLVAADRGGAIGFLAAYSGNIAHSNSHEYFVPPVYDLLSPDGYFKEEERLISAINAEIDGILASTERREAAEAAERAMKESREAVEAFALTMKESKARRDAIRLTRPDAGELARLTAESQFQKAEMRRLKRRLGEAAEAAREAAQAIESRVSRLKEERRERSAALQRRLFGSFRMLNARGERKSLTDIFSETASILPPAGAGECAAPKLLQYAYANGYRPIAMGEFWWGASPVGEMRRHGYFYPACKSKCAPILAHMLQGLDVEPLADAAGSVGEGLRIVYDDAAICVAEKPAGMLSAPGKIAAESALDIIARRFPGAALAHRLDMHTSGLLLAAKTREAYRSLQRQFAGRTVEKVYVAVADGTVEADSGEIRLPLRLDYDNRPRQTVDFSGGKPAATLFKVVARNADGTTRLELRPLTGRTHQLRVHAAHPLGLNAPIVGDMLYGKPARRLFLHAAELTITHPATNERLTFRSDPDF